MLAKMPICRVQAHLEYLWEDRYILFILSVRGVAENGIPEILVPAAMDNN